MKVIELGYPFSFDLHRVCFSEIQDRNPLPFVGEIVVTDDMSERIDLAWNFAGMLRSGISKIAFQKAYPDKVTQLLVSVNKIASDLGTPCLIPRKILPDQSQYMEPDLTKGDVQRLISTEKGMKKPPFNDSTALATLYLACGFAGVRDQAARNIKIDWALAADSVATTRRFLEYEMPSFLTIYIGSYANDLANMCKENGIAGVMLKASMSAAENLRRI